MEAAKLIKSLTWSDASYTLNEFLDKFGVPNLVCAQDGHYGMNDACTFDNDQVLMLHALRTRHNLMVEDSDGRPIAIPLKCENKLLLCPLSIYCRYDPIYVTQMSHVYPDIKYFRVLENHWNERIEYLKPESILEIEHIDSMNSAVKFRDIDQPLPISCRVVFEPLLDYCEYTLRSVVSFCGLPAKVRFLPTPNANQELDNEFENLVSKLGKVTVVHSAKPHTVVVATKINADSLGLAKTSVKCSQIPKDYNINVCVAERLLKNDPAYVNIVRKLNQAFLDKYDLKELDNLDKCQYLDQPNGDSKGILRSVLVAKVHEQNNVPELLPRNLGYVKLPPAPPPKPTSRRGRKIAPPICDQQSQKAETVRQYERCKGTNEKTQTLGQYDDVKPRCPIGKYAYKKDYHIYESISDDSGDDDYEDIDDNEYEDVDDHVTKTSHDYVDMTSQDHVTMASQAHVSMTSQSYANVTSEDHVNMTSEEDQYYTMSGSFPQNKRNDNENCSKSPRLGRKSKNLTETTGKLEFARKILLKLPFLAGPSTLRTDNKTSTEITRLETRLSPRLERKSENLTEKTKLESGRKCFLKLPFPADASTLRPDNKTSTEITRSEANSENSDKSIKLEVDNKTSQKVPIPTDLSTQNLKPDSDNSVENITLEPASKKLIPKTENRSTVPTRKPVFPIPKHQCALPIRKTLSAIPIPTELSSLSVEGVGRLLTSINMACYAGKFQEEQIDGEILMELDETALKSLDLMPFHVRKLIKVIAGWRPNVDSNKD